MRWIPHAKCFELNFHWALARWYFLLLGFSSLLENWPKKILWFFLVPATYSRTKRWKNAAKQMQLNGWQDLMDRVHAGLIKEKDCAEVANGPFGLTVLDSPGGHCCDLFFWGMVKKVSLLINKVTSNWEINWEVKRALWITWQTCLSKQLMITPAARRGKHLKICPASMGDGGSFFPYFYHISFPYFYHGCCCFCFFDFWGTVWKVACYLGPGRFGAKGVSEIR